MTKYRFLHIFTLMTLAGLLAVAAGCNEKDVKPADDAEQITRYINETEIGLELFRFENLLPIQTYEIPGLSGVYFDTVIGHARTVSVDVGGTDEFIDYGSLGMLREAKATVIDEYEVVTSRVDSAGLPADTTTRPIFREGFFLKLFNDDKPFLGWDLWAYKSLNAPTFPSPVQVNVTITNASGLVIDQFPGDEAHYTFRPQGGGSYYVPIRDIETAPSGASFILETTVRNASTPIRYFQSLEAETDSGFVGGAMNQLTRAAYIDTVNSPNPNRRLWNLIFIQSITDSSRAFARGWCIPYRVPQ